MSEFIEKRSVIRDTARIDYEDAIVYEAATVPSFEFLMMSENNFFIITEDGKLINI